MKSFLFVTAVASAAAVQAASVSTCSFVYVAQRNPFLVARNGLVRSALSAGLEDVVRVVLEGSVTDCRKIAPKQVLQSSTRKCNLY